MAQKIKLKKSNIVDRMPSASTMDYGEVYVNYASGIGKAFLSTVKNGKTSVAQFMEKEYNDTTYATKAEASDYAAAALANSEDYADVISGNIQSHLLATYATSANTHNRINNAYNNATAYTKGTVSANIKSHFTKYATSADTHNTISAVSYNSKYSYKTGSGDTAGEWSVEIPGITEYYDGLTIRIRLEKSYNSTRNYLNVNGLGFKIVCFNRGTNLTSHYAQYSELRLVYRTDACGGGIKAHKNLDGLVSGTTYYDGWVIETIRDTTDTYTLRELYARYYAGERITCYQILSVNKDYQLVPLLVLSAGTNTTSSNRTVTTQAIRPYKFYYYSSTSNVTTGSTVAGDYLYNALAMSYVRYTFMTDMPAYSAIYLRGAYDKDTDLFTLYNADNTSLLVCVPSSTATNITLSTYFVEGWDYIYLGQTYNSVNYFYLSDNHPMYHFDGTNLVDYENWRINNAATKAEASEYAAAALANAKSYVDLLSAVTVTGASMNSNASVPSVTNGVLTIPTISGPLGPTGIQGVNGPTGAQGVIGPTGARGVNGVNGPTGAQGVIGPTGARGVNGVNGPTGAQGVIGPTGARGVNGVNGPTGARGVNGVNGPTGAQGVIGPTGARGVNGVNGPTGAQGVIGPTGARGVNGVNGPTGAQGVIGPTGARGVNGVNGPTGAQGVIGPTGARGVNGVNGPTGSVGATGPVFTVTTASTKHYLMGLNATAATIGASTVHTNANAYVDGGSLYSNGKIVALSADTHNTISAVSYDSRFSYKTKSGDTAGEWNIEIPEITEYYDGLTIKIRLETTYNSSRNFLNVNGLGYKMVCLRRGSALTSHYAQYSELKLTYRDDACGTGITSTRAVGSDITSGQTCIDGWVIENFYDSGDSPNYRYRNLYNSNYTSERITRYQILVLDVDNRLMPLTLVPTGNLNTGTTKPVNTKGFRPYKMFFYNATSNYNSGTTANSLHSYLYEGIESTSARYTFNGDIQPFQDIYLRGTYNQTEDLFYLNSGLTDFYVQIPTSAGSITLNNYLNNGDDYIYFGTSYYAKNYFSLSQSHRMYHFDGTNLVEYENWRINSLSAVTVTGASMNSNASVPSVTNGVLTIPTVSGPQGPTGARGVNGVNGPTGARGVNGVNGPTGAQGVIGPTGARGVNGVNGPTGARGVNGVNGPTGARGVNGVNGPTGAQGVIGPTGARGVNGVNGPTGAQGVIGPTGARGETGPSFNVSPTSAKIYFLGFNNGSSSSGPIGDTTVKTSNDIYAQDGYLFSLSDERYKEFLGDVKCDLNDLKNIPKKYFIWKNSENKKIEIGTSAQEIMKYYPEVVDYDDVNNKYSVSYERLSIIALRAVDELYNEINKLKAEIEKLKNK